MQSQFRFSFGPWNIHEGADPFGPVVRGSMNFAEKLKLFKPMGYDGVQFHDDDAVPDMNDLDSAGFAKKAAELVPEARRYTDWRELLAKEGDQIDSVNASVPDTLLKWDQKRLRVTNSEAADKLLRREYRKGWEV